MSLSRPWPTPFRLDRTIGLLGDTHFGMIAAGRVAKAGRALRDDKLMPTPAAWVQCGDLAQAPVPAQDAQAIAWRDTYLGSTPLYSVVGNHDVDGVFGGSTRTGSQAAIAQDMPGRDWTVDLGFVRLIGLGIEGVFGGYPTLDDTSVAYLDAQLAAAGDQPCFVASHAPLFNTVGAGGPATEYRSTDAGFYYPNDNAIRAVLADHGNAKAWLCGHTHSPIGANNLAAGHAIGAHTVAVINASCIEYVGNVSRDPNHQMIALFLTYLDNPERIEVRFRDLGAGIWTGPNGGLDKVKTVAL